MQKIIRLTLSSILGLQLSACSLGPVKTPPSHTYILTANHTLPISKNPKYTTLLIMPPDAAPGYDSTRMIYTLQPYELQTFARNRWAAPPAEMLGSLLMQTLQESGCFRAVVVPPFTGETDFTLKTHLLNLQQIFLGNPEETHSTSQIHIQLQITLLENKKHQVIQNQLISITAPVSGKHFYDGVTATNQAVNQALKAIRQKICLPVKI